MLAEGVEAASVALVRDSTGEVVASSIPDEDGFYTLAYQHRGRKAPYTKPLGNTRSSSPTGRHASTAAGVFRYHHDRTRSELGR
jgi:hypothetical protein